MVIAPAASAAPLDVLVVGSTFLDIVLTGIDHMPAPGEEVWAAERRISAGGAANVAVAAARLGLRTRLVTTIGADDFGATVQGLLEAEPGLTVSPAERDAARTTPLTVAVTGPADRSFLSHGTLEPSQAAIREAARAEHAAIVFTALDLEPPTWVDTRRARGSVVFAGVGWDERHGWSSAVFENLAYVDVLVLNAAEAVAYTGADSAADALPLLADAVPLPVITLGAAGVLAFDAASGTAVSVPAVRGPIADTTGAGDAFTAALMRATISGLPLVDALHLAALCAGLTTRGLGGATAAPRPADLAAWRRTDGGATAGYGFLPELLRSSPDADGPPDLLLPLHPPPHATETR